MTPLTEPPSTCQEAAGETGTPHIQHPEHKETTGTLYLGKDLSCIKENH